MNPISRVLGSLIAGAAFGVPLIIVISSPLGFFEAVIAFFMSVFMFASFGAIWKNADDEVAESKKKRKRGDRLNRILRELDDDDLEALRYRLMDDNDDDGRYALGSNGELVKRR